MSDGGRRRGGGAFEMGCDELGVNGLILYGGTFMLIVNRNYIVFGLHCRRVPGASSVLVLGALPVYLRCGGTGTELNSFDSFVSQESEVFRGEVVSKSSS
jgi:hypothetical protein